MMYPKTGNEVGKGSGAQVFDEVLRELEVFSLQKRRLRDTLPFSTTTRKEAVERCYLVSSQVTKNK